MQTHPDQDEPRTDVGTPERKRGPVIVAAAVAALVAIVVLLHLTGVIGG